MHQEVVITNRSVQSSYDGKPIDTPGTGGGNKEM